MKFLRNLFLSNLNTKINKYKSIAIYGTGNHTNKLLDKLTIENKNKIVGIIDKNPNKIGNYIYGYEIFKLSDLKDKIDAIIISSDVYQQIIYERIAYLKEENIDIIKIYDKEFFIPTASNIVCEKIESKYQVNELKKDNYELWNRFVDESPQGCIFNKTWYLEAVQSKFKIYVANDKEGNILGGMILPQLKQRKFLMPIITQTLGILLKDFYQLKYANRISKEQDIIQSLVNAIPECDKYSISFNYNFTNWLPFMWSGYNQYCRYTYVIENLDDLDQIFNNMKSNLKNKISKCTRNNIKVVSNLSIEDFYMVNEKTFKRQGLNIPYSLDFIKHFDKILNNHNARKIFFAVDEFYNIHAANYIIYDNNGAYNLLAGNDFLYRNSGGQALALWEAIKFSAKVTKKFDFEGSCIKNIEEFFRSFGGIRKMYFNIWKDNS